MRNHFHVFSIDVLFLSKSLFLLSCVDSKARYTALGLMRYKKNHTWTIRSAIALPVWQRLIRLKPWLPDALPDYLPCSLPCAPVSLA